MNKEGNIVYLKTKHGKILKCYKSEQMHKTIYYPVKSETNGYVDYNDFEKIFNIDDLYEEYDNLQQRIDKAIEYIENTELGELENGKPYFLKDDETGKYLLSILKGENNEKNND